MADDWGKCTWMRHPCNKDEKKNNVGAAHVALIVSTRFYPHPFPTIASTIWDKKGDSQTRCWRMATCSNLDRLCIFRSVESVKLLIENIVSFPHNYSIESAADNEIDIRPNAANNINKWEGEDDDEDVKVWSCTYDLYHIVYCAICINCCWCRCCFCATLSKLVFGFVFVFRLLLCITISLSRCTRGHFTHCMRCAKWLI